MQKTNNLIYQYWDGPMTSGVEAGVKAMNAYADRIGVEYLFELNPKFVTNLGKYSPHYGQFKIAFDPKFDHYDHILFADTDVFPIDNLEDSIFDRLHDADVGICTEPMQPEIRETNTGQINKANDERWADIVKKLYNANVPRDIKGRVKVYNSGVVLYNRNALNTIKTKFVKFDHYVNTIRSASLPPFYTCDQPYLHAMLFASGLNVQELNNGWNSIVHFIGPKDSSGNRAVNDQRDYDTKFVHIQLSNADYFDSDKLWRITNLPEKDWKL